MHTRRTGFAPGTSWRKHI